MKRVQKRRELLLAHFTASHREIAVPDRTESAHIAGDGYVVRRVRHRHCGPFFLHQPLE